MKDSLILKKKTKKFKKIYKKPSKTVKLLSDKKESGILTKNSSLGFIFYIIPVTVFFAFMIIFALNIETRQNIKQQQLKTLDYVVKLSPFPYMDKFIPPDITAEAAIITDNNSQMVFYSKNPSLRFSMASTTKLMTALVASDYYHDDSIITIYTPKVEGSNIGFYQGQKFYYKDLLYAMLLPSSNEAALALAQNYPGGTENFTRQMNEKAAELNLNNTHFKDPIGLDDDNNYTTASDLAKLASVAIKNNEISHVTSTKNIIITDADKLTRYKLENLNKLLGFNGVNGIKTGTTNGAGEVLVTSKVENGHTYIIIVMKSDQRFVDTKTLISLLSNNIRYITPADSVNSLQSLVIGQ